jgi:hypothetical protein
LQTKQIRFRTPARAELSPRAQARRLRVGIQAVSRQSADRSGQVGCGLALSEAQPDPVGTVAGAAGRL